MSFDGYKDIIEEGDTVILYLTVDHIYNVKAEAKTLSKKGTQIENVVQTRHGALKCADLVGRRFGSKVTLSKGWGYVLQPNPELWTITLPHRTQIIYTPDISMIIFQLEIAPGSIVVESGTGSGSLSHALIRAVKPHGHLYTFDFHENRVNLAKNEFKQHGLENYVTVAKRDVCSNGYGSELDQKADAIFLDLPDPWLAIPHSLNCLKETGGRICSFSPCIEQVQKSCVILSKLGFQEIQTMEVIQSMYSVHTRTVKMLSTNFVRTEKDGTETKNKEKESEKLTEAVAFGSSPGHTGFLTFASLPPVWARNIQISLNEEEDGAETINN